MLSNRLKHKLLVYIILSILSLVNFISFSYSKTKYKPIRLADGFDYPVGKPNAYGYYKARGFTKNGHRGEDWNGKGGGNSDLGDPVYCIGAGIVVYSKDVRKGWGKVVIIRHAYRDNSGKVKFIDSLYGHLNVIYSNANLGAKVNRGDKIGTIGTAHGRYIAHLHFEIRKNIYVGMHRSSYKTDYSVYHDPTYFIKNHRKLQVSFFRVKVPINTFRPYN